MKTTIRSGSWSDVCALPAGGFIHVVAEPSSVAAFAGHTGPDPIWRQTVATDFLRYIRCAPAPDGSVCAVGQGGDGRAWFVGPGIAEPLGLTYGVNPVALRHDGHQWIAYVVTTPDRYQVVQRDGTKRDVVMPSNSQGIRDVLADGTVVFGAPTYEGTFGEFHFGEYQRRDGFVVGQYESAVGVLIEPTHHFFRARTGQVNSGVHMASSGNRLAVCALTESGAWFRELEPPFPQHEPAAGPAIVQPAPAAQPQNPPAVTITQYGPQRGQAPLVVHAIAAVTSGVVDTLTWRSRREGIVSWTSQMATAAQLEHDFTFVEPGIYEISLRGEGPGGAGETGLRRTVAVDSRPADPAVPVSQPTVVQPSAPPPATSFSPNVTLRTRRGHFVCADLGTDWQLVADRLEAGAWETFTVEPAGGDVVRLKAANGKYVSAENGGGREVVANRELPGVWERFRVIDDNAGVALQTSNGSFLCVDGASGAVRADAASVDGAEIFTPSSPLIRTFTPGRIAGRLRVDDRFFVNDAGTFRPVFASALSLLRRSDDEVRGFLDWTAQTGFNGVRTFAGALTWASQTAAAARQRIPFLLTEAGRRGLYVEVTAITDSRDGSYDPDGHFLALARACEAVDNAIIEVANEPYHGTQLDKVHGADYLLGLGRQARIPFALGASADDESPEMAGGSFITVHLDRGRDKWNQVRRVRELAALSETTRKPVLNNEPIGAAESRQPGRRESDPAFFFCMGALNRLFEVGGVFHFDAGLDAVPPGAVQQACAEAYVAGSRVIPVEDRLAFKNAGWADSPVARARFEETIVRAYSGVTGARAWTVLVGLTGDPGLELQQGWRTGNRLAERPGVAVLELQR